MTNHQTFEDRLLIELRQVVADRPAVAPVPPPRVRRRRARIAALAGGVAAALGAVVLVASSGDTPESAYALTPRADGSVTVHITSLRDAAGLQQSLRAAGIPATVRYVKPGEGKACAPPKGGMISGSQQRTADGADDAGPSLTRSTEPPANLPDPPAGAATMRVQVRPDGVTFTVDPGVLKPDDHVSITTSDGKLSSIGVMVTKGAPEGEPCVPAPPPAT